MAVSLSPRLSMCVAFLGQYDDHVVCFISREHVLASFFAAYGARDCACAACAAPPAAALLESQTRPAKLSWKRREARRKQERTYGLAHEDGEPSSEPVEGKQRGTPWQGVCPSDTVKESERCPLVSRTTGVKHLKKNTALS